MHAYRKQQQSVQHRQTDRASDKRPQGSGQRNQQLPCVGGGGLQQWWRQHEERCEGENEASSWSGINTGKILKYVYVNPSALYFINHTLCMNKKAKQFFITLDHDLYKENGLSCEPHMIFSLEIWTKIQIWTICRRSRCLMSWRSTNHFS